MHRGWALYLLRATESVNGIGKLQRTEGNLASRWHAISPESKSLSYIIEGSKQSGLTKLTQHGAHVRVRRVEVNGAIRALECRILAE